MKFTLTQRRILQELFKANRPLTTAQVANVSEIQWITADANLEVLESNNYVKSKESGNATYWYLVTYKHGTKKRITPRIPKPVYVKSYKRGRRRIRSHRRKRPRKST